MTGACLPTFAYRAAALAAETDLNDFVTSEADAADRGGMVLVTAGDLNSFGNTRLDSWGGSYMVRESCLAKRLEHLQMIDTFRALRPEPKAFTYVRNESVASN